MICHDMPKSWDIGQPHMFIGSGNRIRDGGMTMFGTSKPWNFGFPGPVMPWDTVRGAETRLNICLFVSVVPGGIGIMVEMLGLSSSMIQ
jgi:hypothetical protein